MPITTLAQLAQHLALTPDELAWHEGPLTVPLAITDHYLSLIDPSNPSDPLRRQVVPTCREFSVTTSESPDPQLEQTYTPTPSSRLIHRYKNRVAFLTTDICPMYCRHCFRRRFTGNMLGPATQEDIDTACLYLKTHTEVKEMLLTGGDPLTLSDSQLDHILSAFRTASPHLIIRICTRYPVSQPTRITANLIQTIKRHNTAPFYLMTQFNHPREITPQSIVATSLFIDAGIPAMNQTVLLRGVNDNVDTLEELCNTLLFNRIKPYYLFQGDMVVGTSDFRVPLRQGLAIEAALRTRLSGLAMPNYTADLPDGGGKVPLCGTYILSEPTTETGTWVFRTPDGSTRTLTDPSNS